MNNICTSQVYYIASQPLVFKKNEQLISRLSTNTDL